MIQGQLSTFLQKFLAQHSPKSQINAYKELVCVHRHALLWEDFKQGQPIEHLLRQHSQCIDELIRHIWQHLVPQKNNPLCLIAAGGYARQELHPHSDIDLLLLTPNSLNEETQATIAHFFTYLWDIGLDIAHSVRSLKECQDFARKELSVFTNLMESRFLLGPSTSYQQLQDCLQTEHLWNPAKFLAAKLEEQAQRYQRFGESAYRLEPNVKESRGGLRDIHTVSWVYFRTYGIHHFKDLLHQNHLNEDEFQALTQGRELLWRIRFLLHHYAARKEDRLLFTHQQKITQFLSSSKQTIHNADIEVFMQDYYRSITEIERCNEVLLKLLQSKLHQAKTSAQSLTQSRAEYQRIGQQIIFHPDLQISQQPSVLLEVFLILQTTPDLIGLHPQCIRDIRRHLHLIDNDFRTHIHHREIFMQLFRSAHGVYRIFKMLNRYGLLAAYLPDFAHIVGRMQFDLYHIYTVDEHTLVVLQNTRYYSTANGASEFPLCSEIFQQLKKPELLHIAALFHDIGKARQDDHSTLGARMALQFCQNHGLDQNDAELVSWLVQHHLLMSTTAQKHDLNEPNEIYAFAQKINSIERLNHLYLLTIADMRGTNPNLWNGWKLALLTQLFQSTTETLQTQNRFRNKKQLWNQKKRQRAIEQICATGFSQIESEDYLDSLGEYYLIQHSVHSIVWHASHLLRMGQKTLPIIDIQAADTQGVSKLFVYCTQQKKSFKRIARTLENRRINVLSARIIQRQDQLIITLYLIGLHSNPIPNEDYKKICTALRNDLLAEQESIPPQQQRKIALQTSHTFKAESRITIHELKHKQQFTVEIHCTDSPGLLSRIAHALSDLDLNIHSAHINTIGARVEDCFYLSQTTPDPLTASQKQAIIQTLKNRL